MLYAKQGHVQEAICKVTLPYATLVLKPLVSACLCVHMSQVVVEALRCVALSILWKLHVFSEVAASRVSPVPSSLVQFSSVHSCALQIRRHWRRIRIRFLNATPTEAAPQVELATQIPITISQIQLTDPHFQWYALIEKE